MIVRVGIKMIADWEKYDMEVIGEASDGHQGMEIFHLYHPDLILTDIKMPGMDGMELLKQIRKENKDVRIVLLTNYDDKENLKEAIRYGANDFIAKNELNEEMMELLLKKEFQELNKNRKNVNGSSMVESKKKIINFFLESENRNIDYEQEFLHTFQISGNDHFLSGLIQISLKKEKSWENRQIITEKLMQIISGVFTEYPKSVIWENKWKQILVFIIDDGERLNNNRFYEFCVSIEKAIRLYTRVIMHICASGLAKSVEDLYLLKTQLNTAILTSTFFSENKIVMYDQTKNMALKQEFTMEYKKQLQKMYLCNPIQYQDVKKICSCLIKEASNSKNINLKRLLCSEFVAWYRRSSSIIRTVADENIYPIDYSLLLNTFDDEELEEEIDCLLKKFEEKIQETQITENSTINKILFYISQNYAYSLSLTDVAEYVHLSKNYVSTLFNNIMHVSFAEYIAKFRVEKAKEILSLTNYKISEVSTLVGFSSEKYFSVTFKNITGVTPKEFRQVQEDRNISNIHNISDL